LQPRRARDTVTTTIPSPCWLPSFPPQPRPASKRKRSPFTGGAWVARGTASFDRGPRRGQRSMRLQQRSRQEADEEVDAMLCHAMSVLSYAVAALRTMLPHTVHRPCPPRTVALCRLTVLHATYCTVQYVLGIEIARVCIAASSGPGDCQDTATDRKLL
jgi:hypothetical protein